MRSTAAFLVFGITAVAGLALTVGCNDILGNEEGAPRLQSAVTADAGNGTGTTTSTIQAATEVRSCTDAEKDCFGVCVTINAPSTGCADGKSCTSCSPAHVTGTQCDGDPTAKFVCGYNACATGYADCNTNKGDGCETQIGTKENCGGCGQGCDATAPLCAQSDNGFGCVLSCETLSLTQCGNSCVNLDNSLQHCGSCDVACADRPNAAATCKGRTCQYECFAGTHDCGGNCVQNNDTNSCGASCSACPTFPNTVPTCDGTACGLRCTPGFIDCDGDKSNGCEYAGSSCPIAPPPPPPPPPPVVPPPPCGCGCGCTQYASAPIHPNLIYQPPCTQLCY